MSRIKRIGPLVPMFDGRVAGAQPRGIEANFYHTTEYRRWRDTVKARAGYRCEVVVSGQRCERRAPSDRLYADHIHEVKDGGNRYDAHNGQCLCHGHHQEKTALMKRDRERDL